MKPKLHTAVDEPTATGWLRMELYGNRALAERYTHAGRAVLGGLRSRSGVNERIASGEAGGFAHQWATLPDGTQIHVISNDDHDTVRIYAPGAASSEEEKEEKPTEELAKPYLWIGIEQLNNRDAGVYGSDNDVWLHAVLYEPQAQGDPANSPEGAQILSNRTAVYSSSDADGVPLKMMPFLTVEGMGRVFHTGHGLYLLERSERPNGSALLHDPELDDAAQPGNWDMIFVLDPYPDDAPNDARGVLPLKAIEDATGKSGEAKVLDGDYALKLMASGYDCDDLPPTKVRVEVRCGKLGGQVVDVATYDIEISEHTYLYRGKLPGGFYPGEYDRCAQEGGTNPHRPHWWPGALVCEPASGSRREDFYLPDWGFDESAGWPHRMSMCGPYRDYFYPYVQGYWTVEVTGWQERPWTLGYFECYEVTLKYELHMTSGSGIDPSLYSPPPPSSAPVYNLDLSKQPFVAATWQNGFSGDQVIASSTQTWKEDPATGQTAFFNGGGGNPGAASRDGFLRPLAEAELNRPITFGGEGSWGAGGMMWFLPWPEPGNWESVPTQFIYFDPSPNTMVIDRVGAQAYYEAQGRMGPDCA